MKIVISGGTGTHKTDVMCDLYRRGYLTISGIAKRLMLIKKYPLHPSSHLQTILFQDDLRKIQKEREDLFNGYEGMVFFERSLIDVMAYDDYFRLAEDIQDSAVFPKYDKVFILEPVFAYQKAPGRWENNEKERLDLHNRVIEMYRLLNHKPILVPCINTDARVNYILRSIKNE